MKKINQIFWICFIFLTNFNVWVQNGNFLDYVSFFHEIVSRPFDVLSLTFRTNATWREGKWTGDRKDVLPGGYRVFLSDDRQTKCLDGPTEGVANLVPFEFVAFFSTSHVSS
jgi:hypothetical protein